MENPNTRPYTAEELEALLNEEAPNYDIPENNKRAKTNPTSVILEDINLVSAELIANEINTLSLELTADQPLVTSKLKRYAPFIILGVILTGVGIYLYYDYRKRKEAEKMQKPENE